MHKQKNSIHWRLLMAVVFFCFGCNQTEETNATTVPVEVAKASKQAKPPAAAIDQNKLAGNWVRTDAPYNLKITDVAGDGSLKAAYFNPKSIHVSKATWSNVNGAIRMYVELRDENYPGSNYTLFYMPDKDLLAGKYFQAVEGVTYDVGFMRAK